MYVDQRNRLRFQLLLHEINALLTMTAWVPCGIDLDYTEPGKMVNASLGRSRCAATRRMHLINAHGSYKPVG